MESPPFIPADQLCKSLTFDEIRDTISRSSATKTTLPGQARIKLDDPSIASYMETEFLTPKLNRFAPRLWLVAKQDSTHISSLTHQAVRGRSIILTENPELHLTWFDDHVYIKPIPRYILSDSFWRYYLVRKNSPISEASRRAIIAGVKGFLRSYAYLIRHKSDFRIAQSPDDLTHQLLPKGIRYADFVRFISTFEMIPNSEVSERYAFGELRLSRLNLWSPLVLRQINFQKVYTQYGTFFARFFGPLLFIFACFSLALGAFQVLLAVQPYYASPSPGDWRNLDSTAKGFSVATLASLLLAVAALLGLLVVMFCRELLFALQDLIRKNMEKRKGGDRSTFGHTNV